MKTFFFGEFVFFYWGLKERRTEKHEGVIFLILKESVVRLVFFVLGGSFVW